MADLLPTNFPAPQEAALASYNYTDVAEGTGLIVYYGWAHEDSVGKKYALTTDSGLKSRYQEQSVTLSNGSAFVKEFDLDFDLPSLNIPRTLRGTALFNAPILIAASGESAYIIAKVRKYDGTTETDLVTAQSGTFLADAGTANTTIILAWTGVIPKTNFKRGETIRVTLEYYGKGTNTFAIGHDPANRDGTNITGCLLKINLPFKIDL